MASDRADFLASRSNFAREDPRPTFSRAPGLFPSITLARSRFTTSALPCPRRRSREALTSAVVGWAIQCRVPFTTSWTRGSYLISPSPSKSKCSMTAMSSESGPFTPSVCMALLNSPRPSSPDLSASQSRKQCLRMLNSVPPLAMTIFSSARLSFATNTVTAAGRLLDPDRDRPEYVARSSLSIACCHCCCSCTGAGLDTLLA
mmetsp:Transcript_28360/g.56663  ORF Transcript_28360/g.56663 Transcript_28360/m.56663 type:complete len:203 (-) Transcript_28360:64-672(-)